MNIIKIYHCGQLTLLGTAVKFFRYPCPPSLFKAIFSHLLLKGYSCESLSEMMLKSYFEIVWEIKLSKVVVFSFEE
jgi:hypothetical protein